MQLVKTACAFLIIGLLTAPCFAVTASDDMPVMRPRGSVGSDCRPS